MDAHHTDDLDEWLARLPKQTPAEMLAEVDAARRAAAEAPLPEPSLIPMPDFPYSWPHPLSGTVRFACPLACGWHHDERPGVDQARERIVLPLDPEQLERTLTVNAEARAAAMQARIEGAITQHFEADHPGR
ncbi:hypothetical protein [Streptomyces sp. NPDC012616]|uniref:hypothetical protein n=1 Tax=Streptomyces sp. NPDC012616 TaxID=3364840 RepID=UPI0036E35445